MSKFNQLFTLKCGNKLPNAKKVMLWIDNITRLPSELLYLAKYNSRRSNCLYQQLREIRAVTDKKCTLKSRFDYWFQMLMPNALRYVRY